MTKTVRTYDEAVNQLPVAQWTDDLEKDYKERSRQFSDWTDQKITRADEEAEADPGTQLLKTIKSGMKLVGDVKSLANKFEEGKKIKDSEAKAEMRQNLDSQQFTDDQIEIILGNYKTEKGTLAKDDIPFLERIKTIKDPKVRAFLEKQAGINQVHLKEYFAGYHAQSLPGRWDEHLAGMSKDEVAAWQQKSRPQQLQYMKNFAGEGYGDLRLDNGLLFESVTGVTNQFLKTKNILKRHTDAEIVHSAEELQLDNSINVWLKNKPLVLAPGTTGNDYALSQLNQHILARAATFSPDDGVEPTLTEIQRASKEVFASIERLTRTGQITPDELTSLFNGKLEHPAGKLHKDGKKYITLETMLANGKLGYTKADFMNLANKGVGTYVERQVALKKSQNEGAINNAIANYSGENFDESKINEVINGVLVNGGTEEDVKGLRQMLKSTQSEQEFQNGVKKWRQRITDGDITSKHFQDEIKNIPNERLRAHVQEQLTLQLDKRAEQNYSEKGNEALVRGESERTMKDGSKLSHTQERVLNHLNKYQSKAFTQCINANPNDSTCAIKSEEAVRSYYAAGGGKVDGKRQGDGKFKFDRTKGYENFRKVDNQKISAVKVVTAQPSKQLIKTWDNSLNTRITDLGGADNPRLLTQLVYSPGGIMDPMEIVGVFEANAYSAELLYKAKALGLPPATVFKAQVEALSQVDAEGVPLIGWENARLLEQHGIIKIHTTEGGGTVIEQTELIQAGSIISEPETNLYNILEKHNQTSHVNRQGAENLTPNYLKRISLFESLNDLNYNKYAWGTSDGSIPATPRIANIQQEVAEARAAIQKQKDDAAARQQVQTNIAENDATITVESFAEQPKSELGSDEEQDLDQAYKDAGLF